jgi:hypothetical protein
MGTRVQLVVGGDDPDAAGAAADAALERMAALELLVIRYRSDSEVGRLNETGRLENARPGSAVPWIPRSRVPGPTGLDCRVADRAR